MKSAPSTTEPVATDETSSKSAVFVTITIVVSSRPASVITELSNKILIDIITSLQERPAISILNDKIKSRIDDALDEWEIEEQ